METFRDKVAVITGAASGIGLAIAERCAQEGMKVVLADIEEAARARAGWMEKTLFTGCSKKIADDLRTHYAVSAKEIP